VTGGIENLTDKEYRVHGSGLNEPGRNAIVAVEIKL
jgi:outer membrane receptor protein involved in Fe transport